MVSRVGRLVRVQDHVIALTAAPALQNVQDKFRSEVWGAGSRDRPHRRLRPALRDRPHRRLRPALKFGAQV